MPWPQVETGKKTLILQGTKTSSVLNSVLADLYHLKRDNAIRYTRKNDNIRPFESGGESSLEFFSQKTDCSIFVVSSFVQVGLISFDNVGPLVHFLLQHIMLAAEKQ